MTTTTLTAGGASDGLALVPGNDGTLLLQTGPTGAKVNALALDATGNGALLGTLTQGGSATMKMLALASVSLSGTSVELSTTIPSWVREIEIPINALSTNGTSTPIFQLGSTTYTVTGYAGNAGNYNAASSSTVTTNSTGFPTINLGAHQAAFLYGGSITLTHMGSNVWQAKGQFGLGATTNICHVVGVIALAGVLDRIRITTVGGTETFDGGTAAILMKGY